MRAAKSPPRLDKGRRLTWQRVKNKKRLAEQKIVTDGPKPYCVMLGSRREKRAQRLIASEIVYKLVESAAANAENNLDMARDTLYVAEIYADGGPTLKRYRPRAQGRAASILKRTSHITVILDQVK